MITEPSLKGTLPCSRIKRLASRQLFPTRHRRLGGRADQVEDYLELVAVAFTAEDWLASEHLTENTAVGVMISIIAKCDGHGEYSPNTPHIDGTGIIPQLHEQLGRSVPPSYDQRSVFSVGGAATAALGGDGAVVVASETKVSNLQDTLVIDQEVGSFHVPVKDLVFMEILKALQQLLQVALDLRDGELDRGVVEQTRQVMVHVRGDHVHDGPLSLVRRLAVMLDRHVLQAQDILVGEKLEKLNLPERCDREAVLLVVHDDFLQGDEGARLLRTCLVDLAVAATRQLSRKTQGSLNARLPAAGNLPECTLAKLAEKLIF